MELIRLGQLYNATDLLTEQKVELAKKITIPYSIPNNTWTGRQKKSYDGYNCLHLAALKLDIDFISELLKHGADLLKQGTQDRRTPLHVAIDVKINGKGKHIWEISGKLLECRVVNSLLLAHVSKNNPFSPKCNYGISHLHIACMFNCTEAVKFFLKNGEAINDATNNDAPWPSYTPLHFAIRYSSIETVEILLNNGADLFAKNAEGASPLHMLLDRLINLSDYVTKGQYAMCIPYEQELKRIETIAGIVIKLKSDNGEYFVDDTGLSVFHLACTLRVTNFINKSFELNTAVNADSKYWPGWTPLHFAACSSAQTVKFLMENGSDITIKNTKGETPLDFCLKRYTPRIIHSILSTKEKFEGILFSDSSTKLLDMLLAMNDITSFHEYLETLKQFDISINSTSPILPGYNLLHLALSMNERTKFWDDYIEETDSEDSLPQVFDHEEEEPLIFYNRIQACLTLGCRVDFKNCDGLTPIHLAFKNLVESDILVELLSNSKVDAVDPDGLSHLHIACAIGNQQAVQNLLNVSLNVNTVAAKCFQWYRRSSGNPKPHLITINSNSTPLHIAVTFGHYYTIDSLLTNGADLYAVDSEGFTPIHLSLTHNSNDIAKNLVAKTTQWIELVTKEGLNHLHVAAFAANAVAINTLIRKGTDVNSFINIEVPEFLSRFAGKNSLQIVMQLSQGNVTQAIQALLESGANIYASDTLQCLMGDSDDDRSQQLVNELKLNENANEPIDSSGLTLLHVACSRFDVDWATQLLDKGANVNARINDEEDYKGKWKGYTPLHALLSRKYRNNDATAQTSANTLGKLLLEKGADVTINSEDGTPLHMAYCNQIKKAREPVVAAAEVQVLPPAPAVEQAPVVNNPLQNIGELPLIVPVINAVNAPPIVFNRRHYLVRGQGGLIAMQQINNPPVGQRQAQPQNQPRAPALPALPAVPQIVQIWDDQGRNRLPELRQRVFNEAPQRRAQPQNQPQVAAPPVPQVLPQNDQLLNQQALNRLQQAQFWLNQAERGLAQAQNQLQAAAPLLPQAVPQNNVVIQRQERLNQARDRLQQAHQLLNQAGRGRGQAQNQPQAPAHLVPHVVIQNIPGLNQLNNHAARAGLGALLNPLQGVLQGNIQNVVERARQRQAQSMAVVEQEKAWQDDFESSMLLSHKSYEINPTSANGFSHFHFFCMTGNEIVVKMLLSNGIDVNHSTNPFSETLGGYTALHFAIKYRFYDVVKCLISNGADVNIENTDGNTPLHLMCLQNLTACHKAVISSMQNHRANFKAQNLQGETLADVMMTRKNFSLQQLQLVLRCGSSINAIKSKALPGPVTLIMRNAVKNERTGAIKSFIDATDIRAAAQNGYSLLHDIVKAKNDKASFTVDEYTKIIKEFMKVDCKLEIDQRDNEGFTALHNAIMSDNIEAVEALLHVGADVNACDVNSEIFESGSKSKIEEYLAYRIDIMIILGLYVSDNSSSIHQQFRNKVELQEDIELRVTIELDKLESIKFTGTFTPRAFLSESWLIVYYSKLLSADRQSVDTYFKNIDDLTKEFPLLCGLLILQYKKALARPKLVESAKYVLVGECEFELPDLCLERILSYVTNQEMKYLIENAEETEIPAKRRRIN